MRQAEQRSQELGMSEDGLAFYDALETNESAVKVPGDETLRLISCELVKSVRGNITIDWTIWLNVRAYPAIFLGRLKPQEPRHSRGAPA